MPIRTNRGRAAVYRRLWGWPMRSPIHLIGTVIMVIAIIVSVGLLMPRLLGELGGSGPGALERDSSTSATGGDSGADPGDDLTRSVLPTRLSAPLATPTTADPDPEALRVAERWAAAWVTHPDGATVRDWLDDLRPYTTEEYLPRMRTVDPANITATKVVGAPQVRESYTSSVVLEIRTDGPTLVLTLISTETGWRVADYNEAAG